MENIKIISSGLTATDIAVLEWAFANGVKQSGWCPRGTRQENNQYGLKETFRTDPSQCCQWNVWDADGIIIFGSVYEQCGICMKAVEYARLHHKPFYQLPLDHKSAAKLLAEFIERNKPKTIYFVGSSVNEDEIKHQLPLLLGDAFSDKAKSLPPSDSRRESITSLVSSPSSIAENARTTSCLNPQVDDALFSQAYVNMYRA